MINDLLDCAGELSLAFWFAIAVAVCFAIFTGYVAAFAREPEQKPEPRASLRLVSDDEDDDESGGDA